MINFCESHPVHKLNLRYLRHDNWEDSLPLLDGVLLLPLGDYIVGPLNSKALSGYETYNINHRKLIIAASILSISGLMQGYLGFGGAIISVPILVILFGPVSAVGVITPLYIFGAVTILPNALKCFDWKEVAPLSILSLIHI